MIDLDPSTTPLQELIPVGRWLGLKSESAIYEAANRGEIPTIKIGRRKMVPTAKLLEMVGLAEASDPPPIRLHRVEPTRPQLPVIGRDR